MSTANKYYSSAGYYKQKNTKLLVKLNIQQSQ